MRVLQEKYKKEFVPALMKDLKAPNVMRVPKLLKVTLSVSMGQEAVKNPKILNEVVKSLTDISGQKAVVTKAKKAIANFKIREGMALGACVTLRKEKMWSFMERFIHFSLPRVRDFRGLNPKGFDGRGNYNMGLKEQLIFPEVDYDKVSKVHGMNVTFHTSAKTDAEGKALLEVLGLPFRKK